MTPLDVLRLYRARLRAGSIRAQQAFAVLGIAVGVALLFASQIASASLSHSVKRMRLAQDKILDHLVSLTIGDHETKAEQLAWAL